MLKRDVLVSPLPPGSNGVAGQHQYILCIRARLGGIAGEPSSFFPSFRLSENRRDPYEGSGAELQAGIFGLSVIM